jgi:hypothetical protein
VFGYYVFMVFGIVSEGKFGFSFDANICGDAAAPGCWEEEHPAIINFINAYTQSVTTTRIV